jgi:hypothetical protein
MLDIRGASPGLLDDPLLLEVGGAEPNAALVWRARLRDDDGFVWRAAAPTSEGLLTAWVPAKASAGPLAALRSLRPVDVDVRVEAPDGSGSNRTVARRPMDEGVRARRWKDEVVGALYLPAVAADGASAVVIDARAAAGPGDEAAPLAAALLASRGVTALVVTGAGKGAEDPIATARERLAQIPGAAGTIVALTGAEAGVPPGVGFRGEDQRTAEARGATWDALLARLGARPRRLAR